VTIAIRPPDPVQNAALGAALLQPEQALLAWSRLRQLTDDLDVTDDATFRMLPMAYRNLRSAGLDDAELALLRGVYRQFWLKTRITLRTAHTVLPLLRSAGVEPVALKGLGLLATAYPEAAMRPMHDLDFLLPTESFRTALEALTAAGWSPLRGSAKSYFKRLRTFHALPVKGPDGIEIDLHRHMLEENCYQGADDRLFERLRQGTVDGLPVTTLSTEDHLINACVHGVRWDPTPPLRWVLDCVMNVRAAGDALDWAYVEDEASRRGVTLAMAAALNFARDFEPSIPEATIAALAGARHGRLERYDFRFQQGGYSAPVQVGRYMTRYLRLASRRGATRTVREFPTYLSAMWELDDDGSVPREGVKRVWKAIRR
jgi:hypothetical protein